MIDNVVKTKNLIEVKNLKISFGSLDVLKDVSIDIKEGEKIGREVNILPKKSRKDFGTT